MKSVGELDRFIIELAGRGLSRARFLKELCEKIAALTGSSKVEFRMADVRFMYRYEYDAGNDSSRFRRVQYAQDESGDLIPVLKVKGSIEAHCAKLYEKKFQRELKYYYQRKSLIVEENESKKGKWRSLAILSFITSEDVKGLIILSSGRSMNFRSDDAPMLENLAQTVSIAVAFRRSQFALNERVKELTCLHEISELMNDHRMSESQKFQRIVDMIPPAFQYPRLTAARMEVEGTTYQSGTIDTQGRIELQSLLVVDEISIGELKVFLREGSASEHVGFLPEETRLLNSISHAVATMISQTRFNQERIALEEQLHHADRLATIGQLAAGVAHELNEPLSNILGFAQLAEKSLDDPDTARGDIQKIVRASLHSREIVRKLLLFARQMPAQKVELDLNEILRENLTLLDNRIRHDRIELALRLQESLPHITADRAQIGQIVINLAVNALQAMPEGGVLRIETSGDKTHVVLRVSDTGTGIAKGIRQKIFMPFFTTKDVGEGTGLGLSVVHGIVSGHGGAISLESEVGKGTTFVIDFPIGQKEVVRES